MPNLPRIIPVSDLRDDAASLLASVKASGHHVVITQRGRASAVLMSVEEYEAGENERALLLQLLSGEKELAAGKGRELADVLAAARRVVGI